MAGGNGPVKDAAIGIRIPWELRMFLEGMSVAQCSTLSNTVRSLLESHPTVVSALERVYDGVESQDKPVTIQTSSRRNPA